MEKNELFIRLDLLIKAYLSNLDDANKLAKIFELIKHTDAQIIHFINPLGNGK